MPRRDSTKTYIDALIDKHFNKADQSRLIEAWSPYVNAVQEHMAKELQKTLDKTIIDAINNVEPEPKQDAWGEDLFVLKECIRETLEKYENKPHKLS